MTFQIQWCVHNERRYKKAYYIYVIFVKQHRKLYVGYSTRPAGRIKTHVEKTEQQVQKVISSYDDVDFFVIDKYYNLQDALKFERLWMDEFNTRVPNGYNVAYIDVSTTDADYRRIAAVKLVLLNRLRLEHIDAFNLHTSERDYVEKRIRNAEWLARMKKTIPGSGVPVTPEQFESFSQSVKRMMEERRTKIPEVLESNGKREKIIYL